MRLNSWTVAAAGVLATLGAGDVSAQILTGRASSLNYNYVYGAGADTHSGSDQRARSTLLLSDSDVLTFTEGTSGTLPGQPPRPYSAATGADIRYTYAVQGPAYEIDSISASAVSDLDASVTGAGTAVMFSSNPGNSVQFNFTVQHEIDYQLTGSRFRTGPDLGSTVILQVFNGFNWAILFYSEFLPAEQTTFDVTGTLPPGEYRIIGTVGGRAFGSASNQAGYDFILSMPGAGGGECQADFNGDGFLDFFDYDEYVLCFETGDCNGNQPDFNGDNFLDFFDYDAFVAAFEAGC
jgi:hypothetical protein